MKSPLTGITKNNLNLELPTPEELIRDYEYSLVTLGHIHDIGELKVDGPLLHSLGSGRNSNFGNVSELKGIYTFDTLTFELNFIENRVFCSRFTTVIDIMFARNNQWKAVPVLSIFR